MTTLQIISLLDNSTESDLITMDPLPEMIEQLGADRLMILGLRSGNDVIQIRGRESQIREVLYDKLHTYFINRDMDAMANVILPGDLPPQ